MHIVRTATQESRENIEHTIPDPDYRSGFIEITELGTDRKDFHKLEITSTIDPDALLSCYLRNHARY